MVKSSKDTESLKQGLLRAIRVNFKSSSLNTCMTQKLNCMDVEPMSVQIKKGMENKPIIKSTKVFPIPLAMKADMKADLDMAVRLGILEQMTNQNNHYL